MNDLLNSQIPQHVAIIMDGEYAIKKIEKRAFGHENGTNSVKECMMHQWNLNKNLTLMFFN